MTLTRVQAETILVKRAGSLMSEAGLAVTFAGSNADLNDPIGWAVRQLGLPVANILTVADSDLAAVAADDYDQLLDLAEYRLLQNISGNLGVTDIKVGPREEKLDQLVQAVEKRLARKKAQLQQDYGFGLGTLTAGVISLDFMESMEAS